MFAIRRLETELERVKPVRLEIDVDRWTWWAFGISIALVGLNLLLGFLKFIDHESVITTFLSFFDSNPELTFNTWFSALLLVAAALGSSMARLASEEHRKGFTALAWLLLYLSLDEATALHERLDPLLRDNLESITLFDTLKDAAGVRLAAWILIGTVLVIVVGVFFIGFLRKLPSHVRSGFLLGGLIFIFSAIVTDFVGGYFHQTFGPGVGSDLASNLEEFGEMIGVIIVARTSFLVARDGLHEVTIKTILRPAPPGAIRSHH